MKKVIKRILSRLYSPLRFITLPFKSNRVLVARLDSIGDYILFRNYLNELKKHPTWANKKFYLLGNVAFKDLAVSLDDKTFVKFYWVDTQRLTFDREYRLKFGWKLKLKGFDTLINPVHSRSLITDEWLSQAGAKLMIGSIGDLTNFKDPHQKRIADKYYAKLIDVPDINVFEYYRNKIFVEGLINKSSFVNFEIANIQSKVELTPTFQTVLIFPGAGSPSRMWPIENFQQLICRISKHLNNNVLFKIAGSDKEIKLAEQIINNIGSRHQIVNCVGTVNLSELISHISASDLIIANESSPIHFAAGLKIPAICISNGNHFIRFHPYPPELANNIRTVYPDSNFYQKEHRERLVEMTKVESTFDVKAISVDQVFENFKALKCTTSV